MKDKKLTEKQRQFAADNHYVLENFCVIGDCLWTNFMM